MTTVDEFVRRKVRPEHQEIVKLVRGMMREIAPGAEETFSYGMPVWKAKRIIAWIIPTKKDITFGFTRGIRFNDKYGLLKGAGKGARHVKLKKVEDVDAKILGYYVKQAMALDAE